MKIESEKSVAEIDGKLLSVEKAVEIMDSNINYIREKYYKKNKSIHHSGIVGDIVGLFHKRMWHDIEVEYSSILIDKHIRLFIDGIFTMFYDKDYVTEWHWSKATHVIKSDKYSHLQSQYNNKRGVK